MSILIAIAIFGGAVFMGWLIAEILWLFDNRKDKKRRQAHPELYQLFDLVDEKCGECCRWHNKNIVPLKKEIDDILKNWDYYTDARREQKETELKKLREELQVAQTMDDVLHSELVELREQVRDYVKKHDLEWARKWGW